MARVAFSGLVCLMPILSMNVPALKYAFPIIRVYKEKSIVGRFNLPIYASIKSSSLLMIMQGSSSLLTLFLRSKGFSSSDVPNSVLKKSEMAAKLSPSSNGFNTIKSSEFFAPYSSELLQAPISPTVSSMLITKKIFFIIHVFYLLLYLPMTI
jgi:hypothetical protein